MCGRAWMTTSGRAGYLVSQTKDIVDPFVIVSNRDKSYRYSVYLRYWYKITTTDVVSARTTTIYNNYKSQWNETLRFFVKVYEALSY